VKCLYRLLYRIRVYGAENIPMEGPLLVASNHASLLDPPAMGCTFPRPLRFMAKQELFDLPVLGRMIAWLGAIPITRGGADRRAIQAIAASLAAGNAVLVFPEGTRTRDGALQEPKGGIGWLASHIEDSLILPVYISGTYVAWPRHRTLPRPGRVEIHIGKPVRPSELLSSLAGRQDGSPEGGDGASLAEEPVDGGEKASIGAKKRLYWELAEEIMSQIAKVQESTSR